MKTSPKDQHKNARKEQHKASKATTKVAKAMTPSAKAAAMAKAFVPEAANFVTAECIQIHGGYGFTWDCDAHLFYRRAKQDDLLLGSGGWHRAKLADQVLTPA